MIKGPRYHNSRDQALYELGYQTAQDEIETSEQARQLSKSHWTFKGKARGFFSILEGDFWAHGYVEAVGKILDRKIGAIIIESRSSDISGAGLGHIHRT